MNKVAKLFLVVSMVSAAHQATAGFADTVGNFCGVLWHYTKAGIQLPLNYVPVNKIDEKTGKPELDAQNKNVKIFFNERFPKAAYLLGGGVKVAMVAGVIALAKCAKDKNCFSCNQETKANEEVQTTENA